MATSNQLIRSVISTIHGNQYFTSRRAAELPLTDVELAFLSWINQTFPGVIIQQIKDVLEMYGLSHIGQYKAENKNYTILPGILLTFR
jgi:hypothetical protein